MLPPVSSPVSPLSGLIPVIKALSTSKTMAGVCGMLALQLLGLDKWDFAVVIHGVAYAVPDFSQGIATALAALATWGRITAKPIKGAS